MSARRRTATHTAHHVVILGAGYAGMAAAVQLTARTGRHPGMRVTVVNAHATFTERMRLHTAATGRRLAELSVPDLLDGTGAQFVRGWVTAVDADARTVRIDDERELRYDTLVYALGAVADTASVPGAADHAYTLDGSQDAALLADRLSRLDCGTVAVVGTGLTGVESAAEIAERYPELRVVLLGSREPGPDLNRKAAAHVRATLGRRGVEVHAGAEVTKVLPGGVELADGEGVTVDAVLWTGGTRVSPLASAAGLEVDARGRIVTDARLRSVSHPEVYAVGDAAAVRQGYGVMHGTCQSGMPTGVHAALCIDRVLRGKQPKPFRFGYYHTPVSLGRGDAVVQFTRPDGSPRRICLTGRTAVRYKETVTASPWPTYGRMRKMPASGAFWPRGGRYTRDRAGR
ncbi:NAD(P)/FAD-dependent oxidoreductase [Streptomyces pseudogriseolus]|uniref:NAD(P)/FAD-dependent oxidoreductase n=1 Tax=Streptomyces pseudogriseolus TaxID=36817 RepID=UPI003FA1E66F